jgi:hypothetical protein
VNIEGVARVVRGGMDELWLFHRGNTGSGDQGPGVVRISRAELITWLAGDGAVPDPIGSSRFDLGVAGERVRYGFTDAVAAGERVLFIAAAEASSNAIDDGQVLGSRLGVLAIGTDGMPADVRVAPLVGDDGAAIKAEGLALDPDVPGRAWVVTDPDDVEQPARLYELELVGPWLA